MVGSMLSSSFLHCVNVKTTMTRTKKRFKNIFIITE